MSLNEPATGLSPEESEVLLDVADASIESGLTSGKVLEVDPNDHSSGLQALRASFVTLRIQGDLRGCMGTLTAARPLVVDVSCNSYSSAFSDPRFAPLTRPEFEQLDIHISLLSPSSPIDFTSEDDLLSQVRPGIDGLIMYEGSKRGTLLPSVWEGIPDAREFLRLLKRKAGLSDDYWSETLRVERYTTESIHQGAP